MLCDIRVALRKNHPFKSNKKSARDIKNFSLFKIVVLMK